METALVLARFAQFAAGMVVGGTPLFFLYGPPPPRSAWPRRLVLVAAAAGALSGLAWLMAQAALFGDGPADAFAPAKVWTMASETHVGRAGLVRLALFVAALAAAWRPNAGRVGWMASAAIGCAAAASLAWLGHGRTGDGVLGTLHPAADIAHLVAAAIWIGALVPLAVMVSRPADRAHALAGLEAFSGIGLGVVGIIVATGLFNSWILVGLQGIGNLPASPYGVALIIKLVLFAAMLGLAAANRFVLTPALARGSDPARALRLSVLTETALALLVLACVAFLGVQEPPLS